jgi:hypothetical protein
MICISIVFLVLAGIAKGYLDFYADSGIKDKEWANKWKNVNEEWGKEYLKKYHWWYFGLYSPSQHLEKFPFSSTILVFLTDRWHMTQLIMLRFIYLSISVAITENLTYIIFFSFFLFPIVVGIPFEIIYKRNKSKK